MSEAVRAKAARGEAGPAAGIRRRVVQAAWLALAGLLLGAFAAGVPVRLDDLLNTSGKTELVFQGMYSGLPDQLALIVMQRLGPGEADALGALGLTPVAYAVWILAWEVGLVLVCATVGALIFWRRPDDWMALWVSLILVALGTSSTSPVVPLLGSVWPAAVWISILASLTGMISNVQLLFQSPDGRFVPRWTLRLSALFVGQLLGALGYLALSATRLAPETSSIYLGLLIIESFAFFGMLAVGVWAQVYRYRHVSGPVERQQTKWVAVGLAGVVLGLLVNAAGLNLALVQTGIGLVLLNLARAPVVAGCLALMPIGIAFAVFRYRLWDIDLIIRRTLIYSSLTAALALVYLSSVVLLQGLVGLATGEQQPEFVTVLSTLAIAALFGPLRRRLQAGIDRVFFRRKYDAALVLAEFGANLRDETDLEQLAMRLVRRVEETMQPESVGLWLRGTGKHPPQAAGRVRGGERV